MKRFIPILLLALIGTVQAFAQIKVIKSDGTAVQEGERLTFMKVEESPMGDGKMIIASMYPAIVPEDPEASERYEVYVKGLFFKREDNASRLDWCLGGNCTDTRTVTEKGTDRVLTASYIRDKNGNLKTDSDGNYFIPAEQYMQLDAWFENEKYDRIIVQFEVMSDGEHIVTFYCQFIYEEPSTGIGETAQAGQDLIFANNQASYSFGQAAPRVLQLFSVDGKLALSKALAGSNGSVSLEGLSKGVYVYNVLENGKEQFSGKTVLK